MSRAADAGGSRTDLLGGIRHERIGVADLYLGDCRYVLPALEANVLITDPPYGMNYRQKRSRDKWVRPDTEYAPIIGDDGPFDPAPLLGFDRVILWGANWYSDKLPPASKWLVWDKRENTTPDDAACVELAWTNLRGPARIHKQLWRGICRRGEENVSRGAKKLHPNQKPVALMDWCLDQANVQPGETVLDTHMGSASLGVACLRRGIRYIGIEIDPTHYATACSRIATETAQLRLDMPSNADYVDTSASRGRGRHE